MPKKLDATLWLVLVFASGCCCTLPESSARRTPEETVDYFQYLLREECSSEAYEALTEQSRSRVTATQVWYVINFEDYATRFEEIPREQLGFDPEYLDIGFAEAFGNAEVVGIVPSTDTTATALLDVKLRPEHWDGPGNPPVLKFEKVILVYEDPYWQVGLVESFHEALFEARQ